MSGYPANVIASSLGAAYAIRVADEHPELVKALILNAPTGSDTLNRRPGMAGAAFYGLLQSPVLGTSFYNVMASERSIRDYARDNLFYDHRRVTDRLVTNFYATSHQPGAQHAIAAFLSGYLNTETRAPFARLTQPVTLVWGKQDTTTPIEKRIALLKLNRKRALEVFDYCRMMPEQEHPEKFNKLVREAFLETAEELSQQPLTSPKRRQFLLQTSRTERISLTNVAGFQSFPKPPDSLF